MVDLKSGVGIPICPIGLSDYSTEKECNRDLARGMEAASVRLFISYNDLCPDFGLDQHTPRLDTLRVIHL